jgi:hypothetical protein
LTYQILELMLPHYNWEVVMRKPSPAIIIALIALVVAASGIASAAAPSKKAPKAHAASARGPRGSRGPRGNRGPRGFTGATGSVGQITTVISPKETLNPGQSTYDVDPSGFQANCPSGDTVVGTGFDAAGVGTVGFVESFGTFVGGFISDQSSIPISGVLIQAMCANAPQGATASSAATSRPVEEARYRAMLKRMASLRP